MPTQAFTRQGKTSNVRSSSALRGGKSLEDVVDTREEVNGFEADVLGDWDWDLGWDINGESANGLGIAPSLEVGVASVLGIQEKLADKIPGYKVSAAFLSTLRANLALTASLPAPDSPLTTASIMSSSPPSLTSSTTLPAAIPPLTYTIATTPTQKHTALKLIADSLAQRRQLSSSIILSSAPFLAFAVLCEAIFTQLMYTDLSSVPLILTTGAAIAMVLLIVVRQLSGGYLALAESINWEWLGDSEILVAEWGEEPNKQVIGAVVFKEESFGTGKKKGKKGVVRAWTVRLRERGRGVGRGLLEELCKVGRGRGWADVGLEEGVYDKKVLWSVWHSVFERRARRGRAVLGSVWEEVGGGKGAR